MDDTEEFEIERIVDHVSFLDAFEQLQKFNNQKYSSIFTESRINKKKKEITLSKYFFLVKWLNYDQESCTWEPETEIPDGVCLQEYKALNNMPIPTAILKLDLDFNRTGIDFLPPKIKSETLEKTTTSKRFKMSQLNEMPFFTNDELYNGKFGMVRVSEYTKEPGDKYVILAKDNETLLMKTHVIENVTSKETQQHVRDYHSKNRSFLQMIVKNKNILKMKDCFFNFNDGLHSLTMKTVYEWSEQSLRRRVQEKIVDWKIVCRDILNALAFVHPYGIHQSVSLDHIQYDRHGNYKLSHFDDFVFAKSIPADDVKSCDVELAPRKLGQSESFDFTIDIYALAIVLLQCVEGVKFRSSHDSVREIEDDIENATRFLKTDAERDYIRQMMTARIFILNGLNSCRFTANTLLKHPALSNQNKPFFPCHYMHTILSMPIKENIFYGEEDNVIEVINNIVSWHHEKMPETEYHMVYSESFAEAASSLRFNYSENFHKIINKEFLGKKIELVIVPVVKPDNSLMSQCESSSENKYLLLHKQALDGLPIMLQTDEKDIKTIALQAKFACVLPKYHAFRINLHKKLPLESLDGEHPLYSQEQYYVEVEASVNNRFKLTRRFEGRLSDVYLSWDDVAGKEGEFVRSVNDRKRSIDSTGLPEDIIDEPNKRPRLSNDSDLPIDI
ncbi:hypothetical protein CAEBREN_14050 [Caenorhabditis brenneri]|uniref:Protein kinase domain-containing protein n=1 Tax=Caenorhabditis brenneri TaxID=135651 RepID=G0MZG1_CAEBE|nr:hypothetical protein CAEBREN_14050 [Caenorhabditis brenneri]